MDHASLHVWQGVLSPVPRRRWLPRLQKRGSMPFKKEQGRNKNQLCSNQNEANCYRAFKWFPWKTFTSPGYWQKRATSSDITIKDSATRPSPRSTYWRHDSILQNWRISKPSGTFFQRRDVLNHYTKQFDKMTKLHKKAVEIFGPPDQLADENVGK